MQNNLKILIACERSGIVRDAFSSLGCDATSCDLLPSARPGNHIIISNACPIEKIVYSKEWNLLIAHPPCQYLCVSGMHWTTRGFRDPKLTEEAIKFAEMLWLAPINSICIENPVSVLSTRSILGKPAQIIQPYEFGEDASKKTCLWLDNLPLLKSTSFIEPRITTTGAKRWANQTDSGQNRLGPSDLRSQIRAETYSGVASCMALTWTNFLLNKK